MKVYVLVVLLLARVLSQLPTKCTMNAYILERQKYETSPIEFYETPLLHTFFKGMCNGEWDKYGVCCNPWDLNSHVKNSEIPLNQSVAIVNNAIANSINIVGTIYDTLKRLSLASSNDWHPEWVANINYAKAFLNDSRNVAYLEEFKNFPTPQDKLDIVKGNNECWAYMLKARSASICQTCSGRSRLFFKDSKGLTTNNYCITSLKYCLRPLQITVKYVRMLYWLTTKANDLSTHSINCPILNAANVNTLS